MSRAETKLSSSVHIVFRPIHTQLVSDEKKSTDKTKRKRKSSTLFQILFYIIRSVAESSIQSCTQIGSNLKISDIFMWNAKKFQTNESLVCSCLSQLSSKSRKSKCTFRTITTDFLFLTITYFILSYDESQLIMMIRILIPQILSYSTSRRTTDLIIMQNELRRDRDTPVQSSVRLAMFESVTSWLKEHIPITYPSVELIFRNFIWVQRGNDRETHCTTAEAASLWLDFTEDNCHIRESTAA